jgi:hypothetical protein
VEATRYFPTEEPALEETLNRYLRGLAERLSSQAWAGDVAFLLLGGGYGRGEGGIFQEDENAPPALYNDLEFYLALKVRSTISKARRWCAEEAHRGERDTGIEIEFKILALRALESAEPSMFYYDLLSGHRLVLGDRTLVDALPGRLSDAARIPAREATRLLFNRGVGLLFCQRKLAEDGKLAREGFIERNHAKVWLALADAVLALNGRYDRSCLVRQERLREALPHRPPNWERLVTWHAAGVEFKLRPRHEYPSRETLLARQAELVTAWRGVFLWLESIRLGRPFVTAEAYTSADGRLFPDASIFHNLLLHLRDCVRRGKPPRGWIDYPRAALQRALLLLLEPTNTPAQITAARLLSLPANSSLAQTIDAYRRWWLHYN